MSVGVELRTVQDGEILRMRAAGASVDTIAETMGLAPTRVIERLRRALRHHADPAEVDLARSLEVARLDDMTLLLTNRFLTSRGYDDDAADRMLKVAKLRGQFEGALVKRVEIVDDAYSASSFLDEMRAIAAPDRSNVLDAASREVLAQSLAPAPPSPCAPIAMATPRKKRGKK